MIIRFLRRFSVRQRILMGVATLILVIIASIAVIEVSRSSSQNVFQRFIDVDSQVNRLLMRASVDIASSRTDLLRYTEGLIPSPYESLEALGRARDYLLRAQSLAEEKTQKKDLEAIIGALSSYEAVIRQIQAQLQSGVGGSTAGLESDAQRLSRDISTRIDLSVKRSNERIAATWEEISARSSNRIWSITILYLFLGVGIVIFALFVEQSITRPIRELRTGTEAFGRGELELTLPVEAAAQDELNDLTRSFNQMAAQLAQSYRSLEERVAVRTAELQERSMQLQAAAEVARNTASIRDMKELLSASVQLISEQFGYYHAGIFLLDERGDYALLKAASSSGGQRMLAREHKLQVGRGIVGSVAQYREPRIALDVEADKTFFDNPDLPETHSEIGLPLLVQGEVVGVLDVQSKQRDAFSEKDIDILQTMADQLALAIENARLLRSSKEALQDLERLYKEQSHAAWREQLHARSAAYHYVGADVVAEAEPPLPVAEEHNLKVKLVSRGVQLGTVLLKRDATASPWTTAERETVEEMVARLGPVLETTRLFEDAQQSAAQERLLGGITARMRESLDVQTVLKTALTEMYGALGLHDVIVSLGEQDANGTKERA